MERITHEKTEARGRDKKQNASDDGLRLATFRTASSGDGSTEPNRLASGDCETGNLSGEHRIENPFGKILEELLLLKQQFLNYVKTDQNRLETRLKESKTQEQEFLANAEALEETLKTLQEDASSEDEL